MMYQVEDLVKAMEKLAPKSLAESWDNSGLNLGALDSQVYKVLVTLTITSELVERAVDEKVNLIIAHHPLIFSGLKSIRTDQYHGQLIAKLLSNNIAVYVSHTNLDRAPRGLNYWLANLLDLQDQSVLDPDPSDRTVGLGRIGKINPTKLEKIGSQLEELLETKVRMVGDPSQFCQRIAVCGGSGGSMIALAAAKKADLLITGDVKYHDALDAQEKGLSVIDAGHFNTEKIMIPKISKYLEAEFPEIEILKGFEGDNPFWY